MGLCHFPCLVSGSPAFAFHLRQLASPVSRALMKLISAATGNAFPVEAFKYNVSHFRSGNESSSLVSLYYTFSSISALGLMNERLSGAALTHLSFRALAHFPRH